MAINIRFKAIIGTLAQIALDKFAGRVAWATDLARMIWYYDANNYGEMARRDVLETFAGGIQDSTITSGQALVAGASGRIQSQDAATFRNTIGASPEYPFIVFPAPDPVRNHVDISVPDDGEFIDNVLAIQNKSHGDWYGVETWGNAAINFKDSAGTERCAVGYSRNGAIQPNGYIADTLYCEIGNPFTSDAQATYFRVMATIKEGSPYWGGAPKQWAPIVVSSRTGRIDLDAGSGGQAVNVVNGPLTVGERDDVQPLNIELTNSAARIREFEWSDYLAITTNIANLTPPYTLDDNAKSAWILGLGYGSGSGEFDSLQVKRVPVGGGAATTLFRVSSSGVIQVSNLSGSGTRPLVADASGNIDDQDPATFRATIGALGTTGAVSQLLKTQTNNAWSNTGPSTPIFHSYKAVYWDGCKLFSADGATEYGTFNGGSSSTGKESSTPSLSAYPAVTLSGADLQIQRDLATYLGTMAKPTFLGSGTKFGDGGGVLLFPRVGAPSAFPGVATGYGNAPISGGGALVACFVDDDTDQDNTTAPATWNVNEFRTNAALVVAGGRSELASSSVAEASTEFSGNQTVSYSTLESRWVYTGTGGHTITLPTSGSGGGNVAPTSFAFQVTHNGIGLLTVAVGHASHSIDGASNVSLYPGMSVTVHAMSTTLWSIVAGEVAVTREMVIQPLPITNAAPGVVTVGPSGSMRSFGFDGVTQVEELFYHIDVQHDYVAGTDIVVHVHWMPSTTGAGNVVWKWDYQWVQAGGTFPAPTTAACPAVAAGGTAWVDKRSEVTISGTGKTYNSRLLLRLYRDPADAGDTYAADAVLSSIGVHYSANPLQVG